MDNDDIFERVKAANPIEAVMEEAGVILVGHGRYRRDKAHDSFVVDLHGQYYVHNSTGRKGDVITWLQETNHWDAKQAVEFLAKRAGLEAPTWGHQNAVAAAATRAREEALDVAAGVFASWLWRSGDAPGTPLAYARGRGWSDETIKAAGLGWTGDWNRDPNKAMINELRATMDSRGVDLKSPAALAVLGYLGDVSKLPGEFAADWVDEKRIPSFFGRNMLVYPHRKGGRVKYLSGRNITQKSHYNLPSELVGPRQPYFNHVYSSKAEICLIVEGQADAVSLAQWDKAAVALSGTAADNALLMALKGHQRLYVGLDDDKAGNMTSLPIAEFLGPMVRLVHWRKLIAGLTGAHKGVAIDSEPLAPAHSVAGSDELTVSQPGSHEPGLDRSYPEPKISPRKKDPPKDEPPVEMDQLSDEDLERMAKAKEGWEEPK